MAVKRISPDEAHALLAAGHTYLDVRSVPEYAEGHPTGAHNAPLMHMGAGGMSPNSEFLAVVAASYPKDAPLVIGCKSGGRSQRAAMLLEGAGFTNLVEMRGGFGGEYDGAGRLVQAGWVAAGLPTSRESTAGGTWDDLKKKG